MLDLLLLVVHLLTQWLDDRIGQDVARLRGDLRRVLAARGDGADDGAHSTAADEGGDHRRPELQRHHSPASSERHVLILVMVASFVAVTVAEPLVSMSEMVTSVA